ncbi:helix-turn-helix transcriptional regulator [Streptomyces uncialis]|uniref:HTH cro/C1-type domain-containing protein n=1 Tax=Streptomyces uncialis TaxID=1048205 RepID=A0A1Q4V0Q4_9ACTN|nr:helix-turn-helix transcriptional regulator [Streptomyces uncialis]OKH91455.1 hypothetical protein AB852_28230 [Streptomyces uncialis]
MNRDPGAWQRLGRLMRDARERADHTRKEFADIAGVSEKAVYNAERGDVPRRQQPPTLVKIAAAHGWKPESIQAVLAGGDPEPSAQPVTTGTASGPSLTQLQLCIYEFGRACTSLGGSHKARERFEAAAQELLESVPQSSRNGFQSGYGLAAYRPHAIGEGVPEDDAERILRAMDED